MISANTIYDIVTERALFSEIERVRRAKEDEGKEARKSRHQSKPEIEFLIFFSFQMYRFQQLFHSSG
jgi:hypothetical protein